MTLKPCPFCGAESLKHYVTSAGDRGMRGVVVCKSCGARLEAYKREYRALLEAGYSWQDATAYERAHAFDAVAEKWNSRPVDYMCIDIEELLVIADEMDAYSGYFSTGLQACTVQAWAFAIREALGVSK